MAKLWMSLLLLSGLSSCSFAAGPRQLKLVNEWRSIDFNFPSEKLRGEAIARNEFTPGNAVPIDIDVHYKARGVDSRIFLTFPRFRAGIPITLGTRSTAKSANGTSMIDAYPDYSWHQNPTQDCNNKIVSVFRIAIDACQRLWVVDTGKIGLAESQQICAPKILVFNLITNRLLHRYTIPRDQYTDKSLFITPVIDVSDPAPGNCANSKAYIADVAGFAMLVYDSTTDSSWRIQNKLMYPYPTFGKHTIAGESFELMDGIFGMALERAQRQNRHLYFHALASESENSVPIGVLNNRTAWAADENAFAESFAILGPRGSQSAASAIDTNGNLFFGLNNINALACWDTTKKPLTRVAVKTLVKDDERLQFAAGMKVIRNTDGDEELWLVTNRFQKVITGTLSNNEINFRVFAQRISLLLDGASCS